MQLLDWASKQLGYRFADPALLEQALTHRSAGSPHNERLEFLGDAVLGMVIAEALYRSQPDVSEGGLSRLRAGLVRRDTLAAVARDIGLGDRLLLGSGELRTGGQQRSSILGNALESLFGALYLDGGFVAARGVIHRLFDARLAAVSPADAERKDPKTRLQEHLQAQGLIPPEYEVTSVSGPAHRQHFRVSCRMQALALECSGSGSSRRMAEQNAAAAALEALDQGGNRSTERGT
ncbi:MAG: ribonuclease III [Chromatiales bacterium]|nr:ribonuclease III [Chromatiales bacterium]